MSVALLSATHFLARYHRRENTRAHKRERASEKRHLENLARRVSTWDSRGTLERKACVLPRWNRELGVRFLRRLCTPTSSPERNSAERFCARASTPRSHPASDQSDSFASRLREKRKVMSRRPFVRPATDANCYLKRTLRITDTYLILTVKQPAPIRVTRSGNRRHTREAEFLVDARPRAEESVPPSCRARLIVRIITDAVTKINIDSSTKSRTCHTLRVRAPCITFPTNHLPRRCTLVLRSFVQRRLRARARVTNNNYI